MKIKIIRKEDISISKWSGGLTKEILIFPENAQYGNRNFEFRISSATVELEESTFTKLEDYNRILMVLDGKLKIVHNGNHSIELNKYEKDRFMGSWDTKSYGKVIDFNLMFLPQYRGEMERVTLESESKEIFSKKNYLGDYCLIYVQSGSVEVNICYEKIVLKEGEAIFLEKTKDSEIEVVNCEDNNCNIIVTSVFLKKWFCDKIINV